MSARAIPTATARDAASALDGLIRARTLSNAVSDEFFERDWSQLWTELSTQGWTAIGDASDADDAFDVLDLTLIAETWGAHLVPLPLIETIAMRHTMTNPPPAERRLTYAVPERDVWLSPFGDAKVVDRFARSLPIAVHSETFDAPKDDARVAIAILTTAAAVGAAAGALEKSVAYATVREQFGRPIGSFQAVKHRLADMHARTELARSALALSCADRAATADALSVALDHCLRTTEDAIQVHGGIGFTWEASLHHHLRHAMAARRIVTALLPPR